MSFFRRLISFLKTFKKVKTNNFFKEVLIKENLPNQTFKIKKKTPKLFLESDIKLVK